MTNVSPPLTLNKHIRSEMLLNLSVAATKTRRNLATANASPTHSPTEKGEADV
jgi:hypothetical protein